MHIQKIERYKSAFDLIAKSFKDDDGNSIEVWYARERLRTTDITAEHVQNNRCVRDMLGQRGIRPESLPPAEGIKKAEHFRLPRAEETCLLCRA